MGIPQTLTLSGFNTQPPEGGWLICDALVSNILRVSTHSRPKAAGPAGLTIVMPKIVSTHSRPKAAGLIVYQSSNPQKGFNTQPPEGGWHEAKRC